MFSKRIASCGVFVDKNLAMLTEMVGKSSGSGSSKMYLRRLTSSRRMRLGGLIVDKEEAVEANGSSDGDLVGSRGFDGVLGRSNGPRDSVGEPGVFRPLLAVANESKDAVDNR